MSITSLYTPEAIHAFINGDCIQTKSRVCLEENNDNISDNSFNGWNSEDERDIGIERYTQSYWQDNEYTRYKKHDLNINTQNHDHIYTPIESKSYKLSNKIRKAQLQSSAQQKCTNEENSGKREQCNKRPQQNSNLGAQNCTKATKASDELITENLSYYHISNVLLNNQNNQNNPQDETLMNNTTPNYIDSSHHKKTKKETKRHRKSSGMSVTKDEELEEGNEPNYLKDSHQEELEEGNKQQKNKKEKGGWLEELRNNKDEFHFVDREIYFHQGMMDEQKERKVGEPFGMVVDSGDSQGSYNTGSYTSMSGSSPSRTSSFFTKMLYRLKGRSKSAQTLVYLDKQSDRNSTPSSTTIVEPIHRASDSNLYLKYPIEITAIDKKKQKQKKRSWIRTILMFTKRRKKKKRKI